MMESNFVSKIKMLYYLLLTLLTLTWKLLYLMKLYKKLSNLSFVVRISVEIIVNVKQ